MHKLYLLMRGPGSFRIVRFACVCAGEGKVTTNPCDQQRDEEKQGVLGIGPGCSSFCGQVRRAGNARWGWGLVGKREASMGLERGQLLLGLFLLGFLVFCFFLLLLLRFLILALSLMWFLLSLGISFCFLKAWELVFNGRVRIDIFI